MTEQEKIRHYLKAELTDVDGGFTQSVVDTYLTILRKRIRVFIPVSPLLSYAAITTMFLATYLMLHQLNLGSIVIRYFVGAAFHCTLGLIVAFCAMVYLYLCDRTLTQSRSSKAGPEHL